MPKPYFPPPPELQKKIDDYFDNLRAKLLPPPTLSPEEHNRRVRAAMAREKLEQQTRDMPLMQMQRLLDQGQEQYLERLREREAEAARTCHRGPGDPDWPA